MPISKAGKVAIGVVSAGGIGGGVAGGYYELTKVTFEDKLKGTLIQEEAEIWKARATKLNGDTGTLSNSLKEVKDANDTATGNKLKKWCKDSLKSRFYSETNSLFKEVEKYCTYNIKDKAGNGIASIENWDKSKNNKKLKEQTENVQLSPTMSRIKKELKQTSPNEDALKDWCTKTYEKPFKGENDQDLLDVKAYCVTSQ